MPWSQLLDLLKSHKNYWLLCLGLLVANLFFYFIFIAGEIDQIDQLQKRYQTQRKSLTEIRKLQLRAATYTESQTAYRRFQETTANKITFPDRLTDLAALFRQHDLNPSGMNFKSEKVADLQLVRFVSKIETAGNYADLKALLNGIRQLPGLFCIERLSIDKNRTAGTLIMKLDLAVYFNDTPRPQFSKSG
jgi:Tfp pilus assembly protein PilO